MQGLSLVAASGGHSSSRRAGLSLSRPLLLQSTGSRRAGSVVVAHGPSCSAACGIFPDQGSNPCLLHWQADSQPLRQQGSPILLSLCNGQTVEYVQIYFCHILKIESLKHFKDSLVSKLNQQNKSTEKHNLGFRKRIRRSDIQSAQNDIWAQNLVW